MLGCVYGNFLSLKGSTHILTDKSCENAVDPVCVGMGTILALDFVCP